MTVLSTGRTFDATKSSAAAFVAAFIVILAGALAHVWYLASGCTLDLAGDEAHYWEWSRRLDWSYYSKGPLVAYIIAAGRWAFADWSIRLVGSEMLAVRLPAILLSVLTSAGIFVLTLNTLRRPWAAFFATAGLCTVPMMVAGSFLMTIDAPLICCWTWTLVCIERTLARPRLWLWIIAGVLIALGILAKYTMVLIAPVLVLTFVLSPATRSTLSKPGIYLCALIGALGFVPIAIWNAQHNWVSVRHVAGQAGVSGGTRLYPLGFLEYFGGQAAILNPIWFVAILAAIRHWLTRPKPIAGEPHSAESIRFLLAAAIVPWAFFLAFSVITKVQPNWPAPAMVAAAPLLVGWIYRGLHELNPTRKRVQVVIGLGVVVGSAATIVLHRTEVLLPLWRTLSRSASAWELTPAARFDPTARLRGWSQLAAIDELLANERTAGREPFIMTDDYQLASEIAFYCPSHPITYCAQSVLGKRQSQYDLWPNPIDDGKSFIGRPCIYVGALSVAITGDEKQPAALPNLRKAATIEHYVGDLRYQLWTVSYCDAFAGFASTSESRDRY